MFIFGGPRNVKEDCGFRLHSTQFDFTIDLCSCCSFPSTVGVHVVFLHISFQFAEQSKKPQCSSRVHRKEKFEVKRFVAYWSTLRPKDCWNKNLTFGIESNWWDKQWCIGSDKKMSKPQPNGNEKLSGLVACHCLLYFHFLAQIHEQKAAKLGPLR